MANSKEITQLNQVVKGLNQVNTSINTVSTSYMRLVKDIEDGNKTINNNAISFNNLKKAQKETKESGEKLDALDKQLQSSKQKLIQLDDKRQAQLNKNKQAITERTKALKDETILNDKNAGTIEKLAAKNRILEREKKKLDTTTKKGIKRLAEINKLQDTNSNLLDSSGNKLQKQRGNIGNYGSAFGGLLTPIKTAGTALKAFLANPVVAILAAIVGAFTILRKAMQRSEEGQDRLNKIMTVAGSIWDNILDIITIFGTTLFDTFPKLLQKIGNRFTLFTTNVKIGFLQARIAVAKFLSQGEKVKEFTSELEDNRKKVNELKEENIVLNKEISNGFSAAISKTKNLGKEIDEDIRKAKELADIEAKFNRDERKFIVENAKLAGESAKFRADAESLKKSEAESSIILLEKSFDIDEKILANQVKLATTRADILKRQSALAVDDIESKKGIADAEAELFNLQTRFDEIRRQRTRRLNILRLEAFKQESDRQKAALTIEKSVIDERIKSNSLIISDTSATNIARMEAAQDIADAQIELANAQFEIEKSQLDKEFELKLKSQESFDIELLSLQTKRNSEINNANNQSFKKQSDISKKIDDNTLKGTINANQRRLNADVLLAQATIENKEELSNRIFEINQDSLLEQIDSIQALVDAEEMGSERRFKLSEELADKRAELNTLEKESEIEDNQDRIDRQKELQEILIEIGTAAVDAIFQFSNNKRAEEIVNIEEATRLKLDNENLTAKEKEKIEEDAARRITALKEKQAKVDKEQALFGIAINTALAVLKVTSQTGVLAPLVIPGIIALGAIQAAVVAARPIPKFYSGTDSTPDRFIAGDDKGGGAARELMFLRDGSTMMVDKPTYFEGNKFKGATIANNLETEKILSQAGNNNNFVFDTTELKRENKKNTSRIVKAINRDSYRQNKRVSDAYKNSFL